MDCTLVHACGFYSILRDLRCVVSHWVAGAFVPSLGQRFLAGVPTPSPMHVRSFVGALPAAGARVVSRPPLARSKGGGFSRTEAPAPGTPHLSYTLAPTIQLYFVVFVNVV